MYHAPLAINYVIMRKHTNEQASDLFTDWTKKRISGVTLMIRDVSLVLAWKLSAACYAWVCYMNHGQDLLYFSSFWHWHGALCITFVLRWTARAVCSLWDQNCQIWMLNCEVRETPLTWRSTTSALAYLSLFILVRRAKAKWPQPQGPVV